MKAALNHHHREYIQHYCSHLPPQHPLSWSFRAELVSPFHIRRVWTCSAPGLTSSELLLPLCLWTVNNEKCLKVTSWWLNEKQSSEFSHQDFVKFSLLLLLLLTDITPPRWCGGELPHFNISHRLVMSCVKSSESFLFWVTEFMLLYHLLYISCFVFFP